jgi:hypothetical protein
MRKCIISRWYSAGDKINNKIQNFSFLSYIKLKVLGFSRVIKRKNIREQRVTNYCFSYLFTFIFRFILHIY